MADTKTDADVETTTSVMDSLSKEQESSKLRQKNKDEKGTAQDSNEGKRQSSLDTPDPSILSTSKKREKQRRGRRKQLTKSDVRNETARILEEFLQNQQRQQDVQTSHKYDGTPHTPSEKGSSRSSKEDVYVYQSVPYTGERTSEKSGSGSHKYNEGLKEHGTALFGAREDEGSTEEPKPDSIFSSYTSSTDNNLDSSNVQKESKSGSSHKHGPDSVTNLIHRDDKVDKLPFSQSQSNDPASDFSNQPVVRPKEFKNRKPSFLSLRHKDSSDSDTDNVKKSDDHGRKKKSINKKAIHEVTSILELRKLKASPDELEYDGVGHSPKQKHQRQTKEKDADDGSKSQQFPSSNNDSDGPHGDYSRMVSFPSTSGGYNTEKNIINTNEDGFSTANIIRKPPGAGISEIHTTQVTAEDAIKCDSRHLDIIDPDGHMIGRIYYDTAEDDVLPRNKSFDYRKQIKITEPRLRGQNRNRFVRDCDTHSHMNMKLDTDGPVLEGPDTSLEMEDDEDLYDRIAERLAHIGDNSEVERDLRSPCTSPQRKPSPEEEQKMSTESGHHAIRR